MSRELDPKTSQDHQSFKPYNSLKLHVINSHDDFSLILRLLVLKQNLLNSSVCHKRVGAPFLLRFPIAGYIVPKNKNIRKFNLRVHIKKVQPYVSLLMLGTNTHACIYAIHLSPYVQTINKGCSSGWFRKTNHLKKDPQVSEIYKKNKNIYIHTRICDN